MSLKSLWLLLAAVLLASLAAPAARAQVLYGSVTGRVQDASGAAIPGANVSITSSETNLSREIVTDQEGGYDFPTVPAGTYTLKVSKTGFKSVSKAGIVVTLNNVTRVDLSAEVGEVTETVIVTAEAAQLKTDRAEVSSELTSRPLRDLPVPIGRNYQNLYKTLPGITPPEDAHSIPSNPSRSLVFNANGASQSSNNTRIDGASSTNLWLPHITAYVPALESIETVNVVTNSFDAEQGLAGGAAINVQIKSGTNEFHGSAFEYHTNQHLWARNFFYPLDPDGTLRDKGKIVYNQYGGTLGGPIIKDKLFFFGSYEATKDRRNAERANLSVPTEALRGGDLRASTTPIYDPFTGNPDGSGRQVISCNGVQNVICPDRINPIVKKIIGLVPLPNQPNASGAFPELSNYFASAPFQFDRWTLDSKVNWTATDKLNMFGRYSQLHFFTFNEATFGPRLQGFPINGGNPGTGEGNTFNFSVGGAYTFSPTFVVDANFGFVRMNTGVEHSDIGENVGLDFLGIPGTNGDQPFEGGFPLFDVNNYERYGVTETYMPYYRSDDQYQIVANGNWTKGAHSVRFGMDIYLQALNHTQPEFIGSSLGARGGFVFGQGPTQSCLRPDGRGGCSEASRGSNFNNWATFLLGLPTQSGRLKETIAPYTTRNRQYSFYARDQWQVSPKLTLDLGTRWEYFPIPTRADRGLERYNPATNKMEIGGIGAVPEDLGVEVSKRLFAPRLGLAYRVTPTFVVRAGYGLTNDPYALARPMRTNHPVLINLNLQAPNSFGFASRLENGIPLIQTPDLGNGIIDIPGNVAVTTLPNKFRRGYVQSWNLTLQKELKWGFVGEVGYVATRQTRQLGYQELNWSPIGGGRTGRQLFPQFGRDAQTRLVSPIGNSHYDSLQARLDRRFKDFYQLGVNYTWSKSITTAGVQNSDEAMRINIPEYYYLNKTLSNFDRTHNLQITSLVELPFGKGRKYLSGGGVLSAVVGGWQVNSIISLMSGVPFSVTAPGTSLNAPESTQRADLVKSEVEKLDGIGRETPWFDPTAFAQVTQPRFGTAGWNLLRGPGFANWDFGLFRRFQLTERFDLQFRMESFNFTNTPHFNNPTGDITNANFARITGARGDQRQFRFGLRLGF